MIDTVIGGGVSSSVYGGARRQQAAGNGAANSQSLYGPAGKCDTLPSGGGSFTKMIGKLLLTAEQNGRS